MLGDGFFSLLEGFDYLGYLEERSHFDRLGGQIDDAISRVIDGQELHTSMLLQSQADIIESLDSIGDSLVDIEDEIRRGNAILDFGLSNILFEFQGLNESFEELIRIAANPARTHAYEQFVIARELVLQSQYDEAYRHVNLAIEGNSTQSGYPLDYRFFALRGVIELGSPAKLNVNITSATKASASFERACTLAANGSRKIKSWLHFYAGYANYCANRVEKAIRQFVIALSHDSASFDAKYHLGRTLLQAGRASEGQKLIIDAIVSNSNFRILLDHDPVLKGSSAINDIDEHLTSVFKAVRWEKIIANLAKAGVYADRVSAGNSELRTSISRPDLSQMRLAEMIPAVERYLEGLIAFVQANSGIMGAEAKYISEDIQDQIRVWHSG